MACHGVDAKVVGPSFRDVAARYGGDRAPAAVAEAEKRLLAKLRSGGAGAWGQVPMPAQSQVGAADARAVVQWVLAGAR